jgi:ABC-type nitrate/sulfonate/bicarbonate transport system permease component
MSDTLVLVLTSLLAVGVPVATLWSTWHVVRHTPKRQQALAHLLGCLAGTVLLGVVFPAALKGMLDPFTLWIPYAVLTAAAATLLGWRWLVLPPGRGRQGRLLITSGLLLAALAMAGVAVT